MKKILILNGSPRINGNTSAIINEFVKGAEKNNQITKFDLGKMNINCCKGCLSASKDRENHCSQNDDMAKIYPYYKEADILVLASPMYCWSFSAQLKIVIDRLFAVSETEPNYKTLYKECIMLMAAEGNDEKNNEPVIQYYKSLLNYLGWKNLGYLIIGGVLNIGDIKGNPKLKEAFNMGANLN